MQYSLLSHFPDEDTEGLDVRLLARSHTEERGWDRMHVGQSSKAREPTGDFREVSLSHFLRGRGRTEAQDVLVAFPDSQDVTATKQQWTRVLISQNLLKEIVIFQLY